MPLGKADESPPAPLERSRRTPRVYIGEILNSIAPLLPLLYPGQCGSYRRLIEGPFAAARQSLPVDPDAGLALLVAAQDSMRQERNKKRKRALRAKMLEAEFQYCIACCALAEREIERGSVHVAWTHLMDAQAARSSLMVKFTVALLGPKTASQAGRAGAEIAHEGDRAKRERALRWFQANKHLFKTLDDAAERIQREEGVAFATARRWLKGQGRISRSDRK